ncbi:hypothetical protein DUNSADRAFT_16216 [Dunaliella salina]|uniref:Secreted protein n=1 Tax=Dunaliella salina TaxID=3046 RepID=A0ABQ7G401_DUNSA|nr:hypothetical protein DUNSADRAFT_16216 [Dunaliella salina]|eukprot:KAF5829340.1 hypothetical protein DUNSADRAFT_16216 [Dunaliella salina]
MFLLALLFQTCYMHVFIVHTKIARRWLGAHPRILTWTVIFCDARCSCVAYEHASFPCETRIATMVLFQGKGMSTKVGCDLILKFASWNFITSTLHQW